MRPGCKVTVEDCTPDAKCDMCARMKTVATAHGPGKAARTARRLKLSETFDRHTRVYNAVSLYTGTGHDVTMYTLLKYPQGRVLAYDNKFDAEYIRKKWSKRLSKRKLEDCMSRLTIVNQDLEDWNEDMLLTDLQDAWGNRVSLRDVNYIHASPSCKTLSDADRSRKHRTKDGSPRTEEARKDDRTVANVLRALRRIVKMAPDIVVSVENPKSKAWVNLECVQQTRQATGWKMLQTSYCKAADLRIDKGVWPRKRTLLLLFNVELDLCLPDCKSDCRYLVDGTIRHQVVLCSNPTNLEAQHVESDEMTKGRIPLGLFAIIDASSSRNLRLWRAGVARTRGEAKREAAATTPKPRSETMLASSTKAWKRKEESHITRFSKRLAERETTNGEATEGGTYGGAGPPSVSPGVIGDPATDVDDGSGPDGSGDDADLPE